MLAQAIAVVAAVAVVAAAVAVAGAMEGVAAVEAAAAATVKVAAVVAEAALAADAGGGREMELAGQSISHPESQIFYVSLFSCFMFSAVLLLVFIYTFSVSSGTALKRSSTRP